MMSCVIRFRSPWWSPCDTSSGAISIVLIAVSLRRGGGLSPVSRLVRTPGPVRTTPDSIDEGPRPFVQHLLDERRRSGDPHAGQQVVLGEVAPRGALRAD